ncbi:MAG TPA: protein translocase subunit SecD [bacterium]|nr:protein translocase subunit SecD [bacterium]HPR89053.1 protein translocase subunit SecD [bacterium]
MQRALIFKVIFVVALIVIAVASMLPTFQLNNLQDQETAMTARLIDLSGLNRSDVEVGITSGELEGQVRKSATPANRDAALRIADDLIKLNARITKVQGKAIRRGLDLQGGTYLVYEIDLKQYLSENAKNRDARLDDILTASQREYEQKGTDFFKALQENFSNRDVKLSRYFGRRGQTDDEILVDLKKLSKDAVDRTLQVLRNRVDQFGVSEPSITPQGTSRILIELPGIQNIERAKKVIGTTALLEFKLVKDPEIVWSVLNDIDKVLRAKRQGLEVPSAKPDTSVKTGDKATEKQLSLNELFGDKSANATSEEDTSVVVDQTTFEEKPFTSLLRGLPGRYSDVVSVPSQNIRAVQRTLQLPEVQAIIPSDVQLLWGTRQVAMGDQSFQRLYVVKKEAELLGSMLSNADVNIDGSSTSLRAGQAEVHMELNPEGTKTFAKVTGMNVGKQLAIVLDGRVESAPNIKEKIPSGSARIDGMGSMEEAQDLALVLRAGALPAPVKVLQEDTVGPSLGQDSINKGQTSALIGLAIVMIFVIIYYNLVGLVADFALVLNGLFVMAIMAGFGFTLTMPGIAGFILSVAMAIDSNVLINERIREELRGGKTTRAAIEQGYSRALITILDSNITTLITGAVLYTFGTGSVKGFAVTLCIGILVSMFTAIYVTRLILDIATVRFGVKKLSI